MTTPKEPTRNETFWLNESFAFVGHTAVKPFPATSFGALVERGEKTVYAVDPSMEEIAGQQAYADLSALPEPVDAVVIEVPKEETAEWVQKAASVGIKKAWIHMGRDTPAALEVAEREGVELWTGTCAVMYCIPGFSMHAIHRGINKLFGKY